MDEKRKLNLISSAAPQKSTLGGYGSRLNRPSLLDRVAARPASEESEEETEESWVPAPNVKVSEEDAEGARARLAATLAAAAGIFLLALVPRLYFMFFVADPDAVIPTWSGDTFHHWQIAYLSKEIGFSHGFLTLWDLKGLEYYWGILHPLLLAGLFALTGSVDIMIPRLASLVAGSLSIVFVYLLGRRFWNAQVGLAAALLAAFNPIVIFNDPSGMVEPFGFVFLLAGIYVFPRRSFLAGILWALAAMARAEAWLFSAGLLVAAFLSKEPSDRKLGLALGWGVPMLGYMKYLLDKTGNPIYPIYWNFLANAAGEWEFREEFTPYQLEARPVLAAVFVVAVLAALWVLWKRPRAYLLYLLGFGTTALICGFIGLTAYLKSYEPWFWQTRFFTFPYTFVGLLASVFLLGWLPRKIPWWGKAQLGWLGVLPLLLALQLTWSPVLSDVERGSGGRMAENTLQTQGEFVAAAYEGGTLLIPESSPHLTYALARYGGIDAQDMLGQMYGPIYYYEGEDPFEDWETVGPQMWRWFEKENVTLLVMYVGDLRFEKMIEEQPDRFFYVGDVPHSGIEVYKVTVT